MNDFDQEISSSVNYWDDWNDSGRTFEPGVVVPKDLVKAMAYKESSFLPTNIDLMQVTGDAKDAMTGPAVDPRDWDWTAVPDASGHYPMPPHMSYSGVSDATEALSIKWGIRWLYAMKTGVNYADGYVLGPVSRDWLSATGAVFRYGDPNDINYVSGVKALYEKGKNPHSGDPTYLWPVKVDMSARQ